MWEGVYQRLGCDPSGVSPVMVLSWSLQIGVLVTWAERRHRVLHSKGPGGAGKTGRLASPVFDCGIDGERRRAERGRDRGGERMEVGALWLLLLEGGLPCRRNSAAYSPRSPHQSQDASRGEPALLRLSKSPLSPIRLTSQQFHAVKG